MITKYDNSINSYNFLGLPADYSNENSRVVVLSVPFEGTVSYGKGTKDGPAAIIRASKEVELFDEEIWAETYEVGIRTEPPISVSTEPEKNVILLEKETIKYLQKGKFVVVLGGEHSITTGAVKAYAQKYKNLSVLQFDAHADLRDEYEGTKFSHACVMRRVVDICPIVQVGIRNISAEEVEFIEKIKHKNIFFAHKLRNDKNWIKRVVDSLSENVFVTIDVDVFDSSIMPSTGTPEPGGLSWYDVTDCIRSVAKSRKIVGFDVVELAPQKTNHGCDFLTAKLVYRVIGYALQNELKSK
ncbi:MAG: agmatinase [Candidatus Woesearchaeota archaeon]